MSSLKKPTGACAKSLTQLFPSTKHEKLKSFDPTKECVALPQQKKKKASSRVTKAISVQVVLLPKLATLMVPKGRKRKLLSCSNRVKTIELKRTDSPHVVRSTILQAFQGLSDFEFLTINGGTLTVASEQSPRGEIVDRRGSLYIREIDLQKVNLKIPASIDLIFILPEKQ